MRTPRLWKLLTLFMTLLAIVMVVVLPEVASGGYSAAPSGPAVALAATCGDGFCDAYIGETAITCPADCKNFLLPTRTPTPTASLTPTIGASPTSATSTSATSTPGSGTGGTTGAPGAGSGQAGCDYVSYESRSKVWQNGYAGIAKQYVPAQPDQREVFVCTVPPSGQVCIPIYNGLLAAAGGSQDNVLLVDCTTGGQCATQPGKLKKVGNMLCADVTVAGSLWCTGGCALAPIQTASLLDLSFLGLPSTLFGLPTAAVVPIACLLILMLVGGIGLLIFVSRRSRNKESAEEGAAD